MSFAPVALRVKRGDHFALPCAVTGDLSTWTIASQIRSPKDRLLATCTITGVVYDSATDTTHYSLIVPSSITATWPLVTAMVDIEYTDPAGVISSTETFEVLIERDVTRPVATP
jgi:hypothetical protein